MAENRDPRRKAGGFLCIKYNNEGVKLSESEIENKIDSKVETKEYQIKIPKSLPNYILVAIILIIFSAISYNVGAKTAYYDGFKDGGKKADNTFNKNEYFSGYTSCYIKTLGNIENTGWYIIKVENINNDKHWDFTGGFEKDESGVDVSNSEIWKAVYNNRKPMQVTNSTRISDDSLYFIKNDTVWFREK